MARIELTLHENYLSDRWGTWEGLREIVQNAIDGATETGKPWSANFKKKSLTFEVHNPGAKMGREVLLIGYTTKRGRKAMLGQFGEGLKLGIIALLRKGKEVVVETPAEKWVPAVEESKQFPGQKVLVFHTWKWNKPRDGVKIIVKGIHTEDLKTMRHRLLDFRPEVEFVDAGAVGKILTDTTTVGEIFTKGLFVCNQPKMRYGYDLSDIRLDRDRQLPAHSDLLANIAVAWTEAMSSDPEVYVPLALDLMLDRATDVDSLQYAVSSTHREKLDHALRKRYPDEEWFVETQESLNKCRAHGMRARIVPSSVISATGNEGKASDELRHRAKKPRKTLSLEELAQEELEGYEKIKAMLRLGGLRKWNVLAAEFAIEKTIVVVSSEEENTLILARRYLTLPVPAVQLLLVKIAQTENNHSPVEACAARFAAYLNLHFIRMKGEVPEEIVIEETPAEGEEVPPEEG